MNLLAYRPGMSPLDAAESVMNASLQDPDGEMVVVNVRPPGSFSEGAADPLIAALLARMSGLDIGGLELRFDGSLGGQWCPGFSKSEVPLLEDGYGNSWNVDIDPVSGRWGPVYFMCHDPPVIVLQSRSLTEFILDCAASASNADGGSLDRVHDVCAMEVYSKNGLRFSAKVAAASEDNALREAATAAGPDGWVVDMRSASVGDGFAWAGPDISDELIRIGNSPLFAVRRAE